jgi:hypothetical protein
MTQVSSAPARILEAQNTTQPDIAVAKAPTPPAKASSIYLLINCSLQRFLRRSLALYTRSSARLGTGGCAPSAT